MPLIDISACFRIILKCASYFIAKDVDNVIYQCFPTSVDFLSLIRKSIAIKRWGCIKTDGNYWKPSIFIHFIRLHKNELKLI